MTLTQPRKPLTERDKDCLRIAATTAAIRELQRYKPNDTKGIEMLLDLLIEELLA